jgi:hypothetical protein
MNEHQNEVMNLTEIDRKSFILGMVTAFAECVANECKKAALSPPFYPEVLEEYQDFRKQGFNPALNFKDFPNFLSYGTVWGQGSENVIPAVRERRTTIDTCATVLLKPGDWPIQSAE